MMMRSDRSRLEPIELEECLQLLADRHFGRLAVVIDDQPLIFPVNYALHGEHVVFRTDPGNKLHGAKDHRVAFEIDSADSVYHDGWSVLVVGTAREEVEPERVRDLARLPLSPWSSGPKLHWMCIGGGAITGRRLTHTNKATTTA
jgi:nitroimidazol reductase NimA-like FMN-containing flavoprotein (pyridoxamine 5'-phosphate oxidase superfamily)